MWACSLGQEEPLMKEWKPTLVFWPGKAHGQRSPVGYSPWGCKRAGHDLVTKHQQIHDGYLGCLMVNRLFPI